MPSGFERATGVAENTRQCMAKGCHKYFRVANEHEITCPHCGNGNTRPINASAKLEEGGATNSGSTKK
ncbi:MAG: hypothetical protein FWD53_12175 [Phycisphaerales bacterium]|nr:hypothetical protein [Phycisphaerales bacterium]